jgi:hypothetical protein
MPAPLYVVYRAVPSLDPAAIATRLGTGVKVTGITGGGTAVSITQAGQALRAVAVDAPVPAAEMARCLPVAHLKPEMKAELAAHKAHVAVAHGSDMPGITGLIALYQVAAALAPDPIGVINPITCMCLPASILAQTLAPEFLADARARPAATLGLWLGYVHMARPDGGTWLVTTGAPMIGVPNIATLAPTQKDIAGAYDLLVAIQTYLYAGLGNGKKMILPGDTIDLSGTRLVARTPYEYVAQMGEHTLVLERATS